MPENEVSAEDLVARFLRFHGYNKTLDAFLNEANLPADAGEHLGPEWTVEKVLSEKKLYDLTANFEKTSLKEKDASWQTPYPSVASKLELESPSNILQTNVVKMLVSPSDNEPSQVLLASSADRKLNWAKLDGSSISSLSVFGLVADSPILSFAIIKARYIALTTISGALFLFDHWSDSVISKRKDHSKYVIQVIATEYDSSLLLATASWDNSVILYRAATGNNTITISEPLAKQKLDSQPECIMFKEDPDTNTLYILCTRRDSTFLYYYQVTKDDLLLAGKQNLAPFANSWISFSPSIIAACPTDDTLLAIATSSMPHMKILFIRTLFPREELDSVTGAPIAVAPTQAARDQDVDPREAAAVIIHANTWISQTRYSTPTVVWRPDGSGVWVNSDEGYIKGVDRTGKVQASLQQHDAGSKVRCLWAGNAMVGVSGKEEEIIVSGGFDQNVFLWRCKEEE
ncbi:hypothetical protein BT63DRAFT_428267 [Microthyrium microscopicum]|uniref:Uncharacterized protein n=1 Tax=Microthyrium microscopicum TaxID=703497 RepID=A0A6A6U2X4_9PEZI|nr:hypothetical protein BT63DRAFT_428267 [Microthyrium microscopicum]